MNYTENKEQIIKDNLKWVKEEIIIEFLNSSSYQEWIADYKRQNINAPIEEWIASGIRLWRDGLL